MAVESICTKGNALWLGDERFLIKGISYVRRRPKMETNGTRYGDKLIDPLSEDYLEDLKRDVQVFRELGLNTIQVLGLDPTQSHDKAMIMLAESGIYVLAEICEKMKTPPRNTAFDPNSNPSRYYSLFLIRKTLRVVDQLSDYANLLGFVIIGAAVRMPQLTKMAEVCRAIVRDIKAFLHIRDGRKPPVGVSVSDIAMLRRPMLEYFTAGQPNERVDFFGMHCYSWAAKSSFQISGWKNVVEAYGEYPVPMYLSEFGAAIVSPRLWEELDCLFSPDMTGVFSGGCLYTFYETGDGHGIVNVGDDGNLEQKQDECRNLKHHFDIVNSRTKSQLYSTDSKNYEDWTGAFPQVQQSRWYATSNIPAPPAGIQELYREIQAGKES
jgi:hypothetical protein